MPPECTEVSPADYADATENYRGWCTHCKSFTRDNTEPDAEHYKCPECDTFSVTGAENALMAGQITFNEE